MLKGVEVVEVNPAYTSVIGMLKYAPQLNIDKDIAGAYVIGRRALGFKEDIRVRCSNGLVPLSAGGTSR
jgi:hypothetical protein